MFCLANPEKKKNQPKPTSTKTSLLHNEGTLMSV